MADSSDSQPAPPLAPPRSLARRYVVPVAAVAIALAASLIGQRFGGMTGSSSPYVLFAAAVVVSAVRSGFGAGLAATLLAILATGFFHLDPLYSLRVDNRDEVVLLALFLVEGVILSAASAALSRGSGVWEWSAAARYGAAVGVVGCAVALKLLVGTSLAQDTMPFMLFYAAVMLAAWIGGPGAGVTGTVVSAAAAALLFLEPRYDFRISEPGRAGQLILFLFEGGVISMFSGSLLVVRRLAGESERLARRYWDDLRASERRLRRQNQVLADLARQPVAGAAAELADVLRDLTEAAARTIDVARASAWAFDASRQVLRCLDLFDRATGRHTAGQELRAENYPQYFRAIEENRSVPAHDARADDRTREFTDSYLIPCGITSMLDAPIRLGGAVAGVVCIEHVGPVRRWAVEEEQFAGSIADFVALAMKRQELRAADERIREQASLLDQARDAILALDPEGHVRYWNRGAERLYGWSAGEVTGQPAGAYLAPIDGEQEAVDRAIAETGEWVGELRQRTRDGREVVVSARWTRVRSATGRDDRLLIATDMTDRKLMEQKLLRAQRLESIGALASGIAHDLNNLLTPVVMGADLLEGLDSPDTRAPLLGTMRASAERAAALLRQILSFAKGGGTGSGPVELGPIVRQVADLLACTLPKHIEFRADVPPDAWAVPGPSSKIDQVLMNLCVNARDAMPDGGRLVVSAENRELGPGAAELPPSAPPGRYVAITVSDNGTGIPPEIIDRIFDPFFTTKEPGKGTGLGLATTRDIVVALGGFIRIDSRVGGGTRFGVFLPATAAEVAVKKPDSKEMPIGWGELVLVVDDEASVRELARRVLETYGYRVAVAGDGAEAVVRCRESGPASRAVLLDMMMPGQDLAVTLEQLRTRAPAVPVILTTGAASEAGGPGLGECAFLPKPYTISQLLQTIRRAIGPPDTSAPPTGHS